MKIMLYKHYKGGLYRLLSEATHTETGENLVVYMSVETGLIWVRPVEMFYELIDLPDGRKAVQRFREIDEEFYLK
jgi:hypothetical protein